MHIDLLVKSINKLLMSDNGMIMGFLRVLLFIGSLSIVIRFLACFFVFNRFTNSLCSINWFDNLFVVNFYLIDSIVAFLKITGYIVICQMLIDLLVFFGQLVELLVNLFLTTH